MQPGSDEIGLIAAGGNVPLGYYKDAEKSASTFKVIDGKRYSFPGDYASVNADGSITLLGRGNQVINTAGEKVFPEEVEETIKRAEGVVDAVVVGIDDEKFGQAVTAVVSLAPGAGLDEADVIAFVKQHLAGFKAPKRVVFVAEVARGANGKADYRRAKEQVLAALTDGDPECFREVVTGQVGHRARPLAPRSPRHRRLRHARHPRGQPSRLRAARRRRCPPAAPPRGVPLHRGAADPPRQSTCRMPGERGGP